MKNKNKFLSCLLACTLAAMPLAACRRNDDTYDSTFADTEIDLTDGNSPDYSDPPDIDNSDIPNDDDTPGILPPDNGSPDRSGEENEDTTSDNEANDTETAPDRNDPAPTSSVKYIRVLVNGLNVRSGPSTAYSSLGTVESGVLLKLEEKCGDFYKTAYLNREAYVSASSSFTSIVSIDVKDLNTDIERVIDEGLKVLGTKYVFGAVRYHYGNGSLIPDFTVTQFDCSSLMQYIFYKGSGTLLDMTSRMQSLQGTEVAMSDIKRGDLLFFTNASRKNNTGIERIGHVALYLGDNYILHTASDYAKIEQISAARWSYYITARRMIL